MILTTLFEQINIIESLTKVPFGKTNQILYIRSSFFHLQMVYNFPDESSFIISTIQGETFSKNTINFIKNASLVLHITSLTLALPQMTPLMDFTLF